MVVRRAVEKRDAELARLFDNLKPAEPPIAVASAHPEDPS
jgi:hypothetical protein